MLSFYLLFACFYFLTLLGLKFYWERQAQNYAGLHTKSFLVSLLIPFRNEVENLPSLISQLKKLSYPNLEILMINDHSEDNSFEILLEAFREDHRVQVITSKGEGKKAALSTGIHSAQGELILTTDADCAFPENWVEIIIAAFSSPQTQLVAGPVQVLGGNSFLNEFQKLDWASIALLTHYSFETQNPLMCSAANLAFRKSAFLAVDGYVGNENYLSGDDEFLLKKIHGKFGPDSCIYLKNPESLVSTKAEKSWEKLLNQRARWASKWDKHQSFSHSVASLIPFIIQLVWLSSLILFGEGWTGILLVLGVWTIKFFTEWMTLGKVLSSFKLPISKRGILFTTFAHPFYVLLVGMKSLTGKGYWKGRKIIKKSLA
ncbi:glycosyltransferase [Algoriphagus algorifonticola]|uniref:glycosyltransferase n=1 Tax=Algoriphagus algorifonticola TaxID=2593007 RepID=UPI0011AA4A2B|nr:glycosyltransferase [Algoriphagus algorifonticola]